MESPLIEGWLWKLKKSMTGKDYWAQNWVATDSAVLVQYQSQKQPAKSVKPKYSLTLASYSIEESSVRQYAFKISHKTSNENFVFAADSQESYEKWMKILIRKQLDRKFSSAKFGSTNLDNETSTSSVDLEQMKPDIIADYFFTKDESQDGANPCLNQEEVKNLLESLDKTLNLPVTMKLIRRDLGMKSGRKITHTDFTVWWAENSQYIEPMLPDDIDGFRAIASGPHASSNDQNRTGKFLPFLDNILVSGCLEPYLYSTKSRSTFLLRCSVPSLTPYENYVSLASELRDVTDWNTLYCNALENARFLQEKTLYEDNGKGDPADAEASVAQETTAQSVRSSLRMSLTGFSPIQDVEQIVPDIRPGAESEDPIAASLSLAALRGVFSRVAMDGAKLIVDEYSLPPHLKSSQSLNITDIGLNGEVYSLAGLLFIVEASPADSIDSFPRRNPLNPAPDHNESDGKDLISESSKFRRRLREVSTRDIILRKIAGNQLRAAVYLQNEIESLHQDRLTERSWNAVLGDVPAHDFLEKLPTSTTVLSTIVDYAGFRVSVVSPLPIHEEKTLVLGPSSLTHMELRKRAGLETNHFEDDSDESEDEEEGEPLLVSALPVLKTFIPCIAARMHLALCRRSRWVASVCLDEVKGESQINRQRTDSLCRQLQIHQVKTSNEGKSKDKLFILNLKHLLPPDLPRPNTHDVLTNKLRPEFLKTVNMPLAADMFICPVSHDTTSTYQQMTTADSGAEERATGLTEGTTEMKTENETTEGETALEDGVADTREDTRGSLPRSRSSLFSFTEEEEAQLNATAPLYVSAVADLYKKHIPLVARHLDSLSEVPIDSFELTELLHKQGICCRHIGVLYYICKTPCIRQLLLNEAVSRSCKTWLNEQLRGFARGSRAESMRAEKRGRSKTHDFIEHMNSENIQRKDFVLQLFNVVFDCEGNKSEDFWNDLAWILFTKFGIQLQERDWRLIHWPQLFLSTQYHTGTRFNDVAHEHLKRPKPFPLHPPSPGSTTIPPEEDQGDSLGSGCFELQDIAEFFIPRNKIPVFASVTSKLARPEEKGDAEVLGRGFGLPGQLGVIEASAECYLANGLYEEAVEAFQLRLLTIRHFITPSNTQADLFSLAGVSLQYRSALSLTYYKIALCETLRGNFKRASTLLRRYLAQHMRMTPLTARVLSLLMYIEFKTAQIQLSEGRKRTKEGSKKDKEHFYRWERHRAKALQCYDAALEVLTYTLGPLHPQTCILHCSLADLYQSSHEIPQCKVMLMLALSTSRRSLGDNHIATAGISSKLGSLIMYEGRYKEASGLLKSSVQIFDSALSSGASYHREMVDCLYNLSMVLVQCGEVEPAIHGCFRCLELVAKSESTVGEETNVDKEDLKIKVSCLILLSDLFMRKNEKESAFEMLQEAWQIVKKVPGGRFPWAGGTLARLTCKVLELAVATLPRSSKTLFEQLAQEGLAQLTQSNGRSEVGEDEVTESGINTINNTIENSKYGSTKQGSEGEEREDPEVLWAGATDFVSSAIWRLKPADYFLTVIHQIQTQESGSAKNPLKDGEIKAVPLALQAAVLTRMISYPEEFTRRLTHY